MTWSVSSAASGAAAAVMLTLGAFSLGPRHLVEVGAAFTVLFCVLMIQVCYRHDYRKAYGLAKRQPRHQN